MAEPLRAALARFRRDNGLAVDEEGRRVWLAQLGGMIVPLPNFRWRREAIALHDAHHLITGHPLSRDGELAVAAWELGVGCYSDWRARFLCGCLALIGLCLVPRPTIAAFRAGRHQAAAYARLQRDRAFLDLDVDAARAALASPQA